MVNTIYAVTGGNKGIGLGLVKALLARPFTTVIASVRNKEAAASFESAIGNVQKGDSSEVHIMLLDFTKAPTPSSVREAFDQATSSTIDRVDVLVSNAAAGCPPSPVASLSAEDLRSLFEVNTISPLMVFQGLWPLMNTPRATGEIGPKFIAISSIMGSIEFFQPVPSGAYGPSKAALDWFVKGLHVQNENLISVAVDPGFVRTALGEYAARQWNVDVEHLIDVETSVSGVLQAIDGASRETTSGKLVRVPDKIWAW
ncbi:short chain dehydrogenase [Colletotrichum graminicola]|uniref:Short chain dehydrogenase n=1 Tax=Colletotrichum graminicola (strain M1.001 / M2 / FGSC 10212) TaxID=645133 RepID=E3QUC2_COLGM|nr:short chain dehydrogenase [Colletotrichum graminicola M1.001]EFQ34459.1 short chain dehydrogenase [Colletotrichum graminicola M1.001]WDK08834.1 short chain dehydrogenase [Colletotrichum graminicola]